MWPSTSCGTWRGSQFGIWLATAVISPKLNDDTPSRRRSNRMVRRRSLRIRRRRPFEAGAGVLRLRRSKRTILALNAEERLLRRRVHAAAAFLGDEHARPWFHRAFERDGDDAAAVEGSRGPGRSAGADPRLVGLPERRRVQVAHDERRLAVLRYDELSPCERDRPRARSREDRGDPLLLRELGVPPVELARQPRGPAPERHGPLAPGRWTWLDSDAAQMPSATATHAATAVAAARGRSRRGRIGTTL